ncbi:MAG: (2Fe-2S)-binding protein [Pseudomonadota bacterium]|nr:(2Fe-2S)-binding protein [Pseudomonadota bacterium]
MSDKIPLGLSVNGQIRQAFVRANDTLLHVLRDEMHLTGTKRGCNQGVCGACTVMIEGKIVRGCLSLAANCTGKEIKTIEGIESNDTLSPVQQAFLDCGAAQCGFCTPGMIIAATALASSNRKLSDDEIREGLSGNLCRCSGYVKVIDAVRSVCGTEPK